MKICDDRHNPGRHTYRNARPLLDALALGYRGVEADLLRGDEALLVGHDRGHVLPDATPFLLNIELKEPDERAFRLLLDELERYPELFHPHDTSVAPAVRPVMVGW